MLESKEVAQIEEGTESSHLTETNPSLVPFDLSHKQLPEKFAPPTTQEWKHDLSRVIRRAAIDRYRTDATTISEITTKVRQFESNHDIEAVLTSLVTEEVSPDPKMMDVTAALSEKIRSLHPEVSALILLGSSSHGGARIREATDTARDPDLDWGIAADDALPISTVNGIMAVAKNEVPRLIKDFNLDDAFHLCERINPTTEQVVNIPEGGECMRDISVGAYNLLYFMPSFPAEVNSQNRRRYLDALGRLYERDPNQYHTAVRILLSSWESHHALKTKHFSHADTARDKRLVEKISDYSGNVMSQPLRDTLAAVQAEPTVASTRPVNHCFFPSLRANLKKHT